MMSQPPWDEKLEPYYILHYTYGMDYTLAGEFTPGEAIEANTTVPKPKQKRCKLLQRHICRGSSAEDGVPHHRLHDMACPGPSPAPLLSPSPLLSIPAPLTHLLCPPGKYGEWRFDKRSYASKPPPRNLGEPPAGMKNELVGHAACVDPSRTCCCYGHGCQLPLLPPAGIKK